MLVRRLVVLLSAAQHERLKALAASRESSVGHLVRQAIDREIASTAYVASRDHDPSCREAPPEYQAALEATDFTHVLDRVQRGDSIVLTRGGQPVAVVTRPEAEPPGDVDETIAAIRSFRSGRSLGDATIRELIEGGRR